MNASSEAIKDTARLNYLAMNPKVGESIINGERKQVIFWGVSGHPDITLREAIDAIMEAT